jgi:purine-binding chemotaxis protein CheW
MVSNTAVVAEAGTDATAAAQWVVFRCGDQRYGFPLESVSEIITPRSFTRLPGTGAAVCGLVGVRGRVVTVFDLGVVLGRESAAAFPDHRLLMLALGNRRIGAAVTDVVSIAPARIAGPRPDAEAWIMGTGRVEDGDFAALSPDLLLQHLLQ